MAERKEAILRIEMAAAYDADMAAAAEDRMRKNAAKYPAPHPQA